MAFDIISYIMGSQINGGGSGEGKAFKSLTLENNGSYTVLDWEDNEHTIEVEEENGRIIGLTYDGEEINIEYDDNGNLVKVADSEIDVENYPEKTNFISGKIKTEKDLLSNIKVLISAIAEEEE